MKCLQCKETPHLPIITQCGHIFCWKCIKNPLPRPCPECGEMISKETITSLYISNDNNSNNQNEKDERPAQKQSDQPNQNTNQNQRPSLIRILREQHEIEMNRNNTNQLTDEQRMRLYSLPKWFVVIVVGLMIFFMVYVFIFSK